MIPDEVLLLAGNGFPVLQELAQRAVIKTLQHRIEPQRQQSSYRVRIPLRTRKLLI